MLQPVSFANLEDFEKTSLLVYSSLKTYTARLQLALFGQFAEQWNNLICLNCKKGSSGGDVTFTNSLFVSYQPRIQTDATTNYAALCG